MSNSKTLIKHGIDEYFFDITSSCIQDDLFMFKIYYLDNKESSLTEYRKYISEIVKNNIILDLVNIVTSYID